jgi:1-acyl-sn-glycerol-3-phosphate acyltransferase
MPLAQIRALLITDPLIILVTIAMWSASFMASFFDGTGRMQHRLARIWGRLLLRVSGVRVEAEGLEKLDPAASYVVVANHRSFMDTPVVLGYIPLELRFFAKHGLFTIPFIGWHLKRAGHLKVYRTDPRASIKALAEGARLMRERGVSVLLFPEGGRTRGPMREFKEGAAYIAIKAGVPIVPVGIDGAREILPMGSGCVRAGRIMIRVGDPIPTANLKLENRTELTRQLERQVAELAGLASGEPVEA